MSNQTIISLFPTPISQEENEKKKAAAAASCCSGRARAYARTREENALQELAGYYCATFGRRNCAPSILRQISAALAAGMDPETVALCMDAAAEAEVPSWAYAAAVMRNCIADGALTPEAFAARSARHRAGRQRGGAKPTALAFEQRDYQPGQLDYLFDRMGNFD